jgi:hypothetical protein
MLQLGTMRRELARLAGNAPLTLMLFSSLQVAGCSHSAERQSRALARPRPEAVSSTSEIARARCRREAQCGNVGPGRAFISDTQCVRELSQRGAEDLGQAACPANIDAVRLDNCLRSIASEGCHSPLATLERSVDCRTSALCRER